jgi:hypothetical protein
MKDLPDVVPIVVDVAPIVLDVGPIVVDAAPIVVDVALIVVNVALIVVDVAPIVVDVAPIGVAVLPAEAETGAMETAATGATEPVVGIRGVGAPSVVIVTEVTAPVSMLSVVPDIEPPSMTAFDSSCMCRAAA